MDGGEWPTASPGHFIPCIESKFPLNGCWVAATAVLDHLDKTYLLSVPGFESQTLSLPFTSSVMSPNVFLNISHSATYDVRSSLQAAVYISHTSKAVPVASQRVILSSDRTMQCLSVPATWSDGLYSFVSITKYLIV
jgi:hypothetical protein